MLHRPGPLQELPLDSFLLQSPPSSGKPIKPNKRPHSPGGPTQFSPAKRRILSEEGIFSTEMTTKSPFPRGKDIFASPNRFSKVLAGPASPARVLDFGLPKGSGGDPQKRSIAHTSASKDASSSKPSSSRSGLAPSPELKPKSGRTTQILESGSPMKVFNELPSPSMSPFTPLTLIPRELPPPTDPQSVHYPGFTIFQDAHTVVYAQSDTSPEISSEKTEIDVDGHKENLPPRRKVRKAATGPSKLSKADFNSPGNISLGKSSSLHTPRISKPQLDDDQIMNARSPCLTPHSHIYRGMRQLMKDELDIGDGDY